MGTIVMDLEQQVSKVFDYVTNTALSAALNADLPLLGNLVGTLVPNGVSFLDTIETQLFAKLDLLGAAATPTGIVAAINSLNNTSITASANGSDVTIHLGVTDSLSLAQGGFALGVGSAALGFSVMGDANLALNFAADLLLNYNTDNHTLKTGMGGKDVELTLTGALNVGGKGQLGFLGVDVSHNPIDPNDPAKTEFNLKFGLDIADNKDVAGLGLNDVTTTASGSADLNLRLKTVLPSALLPTLSTNLVVHYDGVGSAPNIALNDIQLSLGSFVDFLAGVFGPIIHEVFGAFPIGPVIDVLTTPIPIIDPALRALGLTNVFDAIGEDGIINLLDIAAQFGGDPVILNNFATAFNLIKGIEGLTKSDNKVLIDLGAITLLGDTPANAKPGNQSMIDSTPAFHQPLLNPFDAVKSGIGNLGDTPKTDGLGGALKPLTDALSAAGISIPLLTNPENILPLLVKGVGGGDAIKLIEYDVPALSFHAEYHNFFPIIGPIGIDIGGSLDAGVKVSFGYDTNAIAHDLSFEHGFYFTTNQLPGKEVIDNIGLYFEPVATVGVELDAAAEVNVGFAKLAIGGGVAADLSAFFPDAKLDPATNPNAGKLRLDKVTECLLDPIAGQVKALLFLDFSIDFIFFSFMHRFDLADVTLAEFSFGCDSPTTKPGYGLASLAAPVPDGQGKFKQDLQLNGGQFADQLVINGHPQKDTSESFEVRNAHDANGVIANTLQITSRTIHENYSGGAIPITQIVAHMGDARDVVVIAEDVTIGATIYGGDGDDLLVGGAGDDHLYGEDGFNHLIGGAGNDTLVGGGKDDTIEGGLGADIIDGGDGTDQATYEHSKSGVTFKPSANDSDIFIGTGGEAQGDHLTSIEYLIGSHFNDVLYGNPDKSSTIEGLDGNDVLIGGSDSDYLIGGAGADALIGGGGSDGDGTSYLTSAAGVVVNLTTGKGSGGDAEGDTYNGIEHVQGSSSDDVITGNFEDNIIDGWYGDDQLSGGSGGDDEIHGGAGNDIIFSTWDGGDKLDGGEGHDTLSYERSTKGVDANLYGNDDTKKAYGSLGDDKIARVLVSSVKTSVDPDPVEYDNTYAAHISTFEDLTGSKFDDSLVGDDQSNVIKGLAGIDHIEGKGGNDTLIGGTGADYLDGGSGIDLADYRGSSDGVFVSLISGNGLNGDANGDKLVAIENLRGSDHSDTLAGDNGDNELDPGLTGSTVSDIVSGGGGTDTLKLDYSRGGNTKGLIGGYTAGSLTDGSFSRAENVGGVQRDGVQFVLIERLNIVGTAHDDVIFAGAGNDFITTGSGDDLIFAGLGVDRVFAGKGNDIVVSGSDENRLLSASGGSELVELDGGAGIDGLSISLAASTENITLIGTSGSADFEGVNLTLANGTGISNFEVLLNVVTGSGNDVVRQTGNFDNFIVTGFGVDEIRPGLGKDYVDGGLDYHIGGEVAAPNANGLLVPVKSIDALYANDGDLLVLDYSGEATAVFGSVNSAQTGFTVLDGNVTRALQTNAGHYASGANSVDFTNIERLDVTGTAGNDLLVGTNLLLGRNVGADGEIIASKSLRGDDRLVGGDGNDLLIGNTGDDTLLGGDGDDVLLGAAVGSGRGAVVDRGEIDTLTGGKGSDTFILGAVLQAMDPIVYYNDGNGSAVGLNSVGDRTTSGDNHAIITDFQADDFIQLAGIRSDYRSVSFEGTTRIYLRDGVDKNGDAFARADELIAELTGVAEFDLGAAYVKYVGTSALAAIGAGGGRGLGTAPAIADDAHAVGLASDTLHGADLVLAGRLIAANAPAAMIELPKLGEVALSAPLPAIQLPLGHALQAKPATPWVTQTDDITDLRTALFGTNSPLSQGKLTIEGDGSAFGTFDNDPFGLGHGIVLSTGAIVDLAGVNLIDGGATIGNSTELHFVKIGRVGQNDIFRADLSNLGYDLNSITLGDHSAGSGGGSGTVSGFDISAVVLSHTRLDNVGANTDLNNASTLLHIDAFNFDAANAHFTPGTQRSPGIGADLDGSVNGLPKYQDITLDVFDIKSLSLGDGGSLGLNLNQTVSTKGPLYLYVGEFGASGEVLTTGFKASSNRLDTPADLSTDLGAPGVAGDSTSLTYRFTPGDAKGVPDPSITQVTFDFVFFSEELVEYAQSEFNDNFKITLNGVNLALLTDGSSASINTLYAPNASGSASSSIFTLREDTIKSDFIYNPVGTGPTASLTRADGYSKVLHFTGNIIPGAENVLRFEVNDVRDGLLDSGILIRGGSFTGQSTNEVFIDPVTRPVGEGEHQTINFGVKLPVGGHASTPYNVTFHPTAGLDLGAGAGIDVTRTVGTDGHLTDALTVTPQSDGANHGSRYETIGVDITGSGPLPALAPLVIEVEDRLTAVARSIGHAPERFNRAQPNAWHDAWTANGIHITHTADASGRTPVYSAVDFGTANPKLLSGSDILNGDLGVSGQAKGDKGGVQDIAGKEALRFEFDSHSVSDLSLDFARFERGDVARIELRDAAGNLVRTDTSSGAHFSLAGLHDIASIIISAASGAFMVDSVSVTEQVDALVGAVLRGHGALLDSGVFASTDVEMVPHFSGSYGRDESMQHHMALV